MRRISNEFLVSCALVTAAPSGRFCGQSIGEFPQGWVSIEISPETSSMRILRFAKGENAFTGFSDPIPFDLNGINISLLPDGPVDVVKYMEMALRLPRVEPEWSDEDNDRVPETDCALEYHPESQSLTWPPISGSDWAVLHQISPMVFKKERMRGTFFLGDHIK